MTCPVFYGIGNCVIVPRRFALMNILMERMFGRAGISFKYPLDLLAFLLIMKM